MLRASMGVRGLHPFSFARLASAQTFPGSSSPVSPTVVPYPPSTAYVPNASDRCLGYAATAPGALSSSFSVSNAQTMRAILSPSATETSMRGLHASIRSTSRLAHRTGSPESREGRDIRCGEPRRSSRLSVRRHQQAHNEAPAAQANRTEPNRIVAVYSERTAAFREQPERSNDGFIGGSGHADLCDRPVRIGRLEGCEVWMI
jgi:hypothetical protein